MTAFCRICHRDHAGNTDTYIACNNCGSLACDKHHSWFPSSKDAYCEECYPKQTADTLTKSADALQAVLVQDTSNMIRELYQKPIVSTLLQQEIPLEKLILILRQLAFAISRQANRLEARRNQNDREGER